MEGAVVRAKEKVSIAEADAEARTKEATQNEAAALKEKQELLAYVNVYEHNCKVVRFVFSIFGVNVYFVPYVYYLIVQLLAIFALDCLLWDTGVPFYMNKYPYRTARLVHQ